MTPEGPDGAATAAELAARPPRLAAHFASMGVQLDASRLGIWLFLASEVLFFGGLLGAYAAYRANHPDLFRYGHSFLDWRLGALNTAVLIGSSLSAAWSVRCAQLGRRRGLVVTLLVTLALASVFMAVKYAEYSHKLHNGVTWGAAYLPSPEILAALPAALRAAPPPPHVGTFFSLYFLLTGLHGIHVLAGMALYGWLLRRTARGDFGPGYYVPVDVVALYWHLVDIVWMFLFPLLYLV
jgi:cytochrome c oxidase subunit III